MLKPKKRITKHELKEDKLVTYTFKANAYIQKNIKSILYGTIGTAVIVFLVLSYYYSNKRTEATAMAEVGKAQIVYESGNYNIAKDVFEEVIIKHTGEKGAGIAVYYAGDCYFKLGDLNKAKEYFRKYLDEYNDNKILANSSASGLGACLEEEEQYLEAAKQYKTALEKYNTEFLAPKNLINMARCYELAGNKEEAKNAYKVIIEQYSSSIYVTEASLYLDLL
ncbi:tol-pal system YbgF family protein [candidate division KSB1 bacterium]